VKQFYLTLFHYEITSGSKLSHFYVSNKLSNEIEMQNTVINTKSGSIEYASRGSGYPVIFIHGGHSNCNETLCHKGFDLSEFELITPSRPGYGHTPLNENISPERSAQQIAELMDHLSLDKAIIYGISAGGLTAIELAANYPEKTQKLVLASAVSKKWLSKQQKVYKTAQIIFHPKIEKFTWAMVKFFARILPRILANNFYVQFSSYPRHKLNHNDINELADTMQHYRSKKGFLNDLDSDIHPETIKKIKSPTLIIHSVHDNSVPFDHAMHAKDNIENSRLVELNNEWGHLFWIGKDADESIKKTLEFIQE
jgi:pimeloyl-ACP methyl ester carboxylesterase